MRDSLKAFESIVRLKPSLGPYFTWRASVFVISAQESVDVPGTWDIAKVFRRPISNAKIHLFGVVHMAGEPPNIYETSKCGHSKLGTTCPMDNAAVPNGIGYCVSCLYVARKEHRRRAHVHREIERCRNPLTQSNAMGKGRQSD